MKTRHHGWRLFGACLLILGAAWGTTAGVDPLPCGFPDNLDTDEACCDPAVPALPTFPDIDLQDMRYFTWRNCALSRNKEVCVDIGQPTPVASECGYYDIPFTVRTCGAQANTLFSGTMIGIYARTFVETDKDQKNRPVAQVWRFLINGDLEVSQFVIDRFGDNPNIPQSYKAFGNQVHWHGYLDYRQKCDKSGDWSAEWVLNHDCDAYAHPKGSDRAGVFNRDRSFNMAGPSTFVPSNDLIIDAAFDIQLESDGMRQLVLDGEGKSGGICYRDVPLDGSASSGFDTCPCNGGKSTQYVIFDFNATSRCLATMSATKGDDLTRKRIGYFESPEVEFRAVSIIMGNMVWLDDCTEDSTREWFEGVEILSPTVGHERFLRNGSRVQLSPFFFDAASSNDDDGTRVQGIPHLSNKMITINWD